ncbi:MAG: flagellin lysine-N-methylase [Oscillospiraceae bacterium]|nr:flagellin lysine-N-methylase [Oscillospiraceae bacterium]
MSVWYPSFYPAFRCRAERCRHSCCRGWEIDVDEQSAALYRKLPGELGDELRRALFADEEGWHFRLDGEERCPFLEADGLCRLIRRLGEGALCDICALHPRFFEELDADELWGLGLSCEEVTDLLLGEKALRFVCGETGEILDLPGLVHYVGLCVPRETLRYRPRIDEERRWEILRLFGKTEPIDEAWAEELKALEASPLPQAGRDEDYQRIYEYLLYRQIEKAEERDWESIADYAALSTDFVALWDAQEKDTAGHLRRFSEQIEYSTENVEILMGE